MATSLSQVLIQEPSSILFLHQPKDIALTFVAKAELSEVRGNRMGWKHGLVPTVLWPPVWEVLPCPLSPLSTPTLFLCRVKEITLKIKGSLTFAIG